MDSRTKNLFERLENGLDHFLDTLDNVLTRSAPGSSPKPWLAGAFLAPAFIILGLFGLFPMIYSVYLSLFANTPTGDRFVGLENYAEAFTGPEFWDSFLVTLYYAVGTVPTTLILSFMIAWALFRVTRLRSILRTAFFLPYVSSIVGAAMVWRVMLEPREGVANLMLGHLGIPAQTWLLEPRGLLHLLSDGWIPVGVGPSLALCSVILFEIWRSLGFMIVVFLAGLAAVPRELEDAARIDGANALQVTRSVTLPMLTPTIFFLSIVGIIGSFQAFSGIYAMTGTGHGPLDTTQNLTVYIFANFYEYGRMGYGAAIATLLALTIMVLTLAQWLLFSRRVHYQ